MDTYQLDASEDLLGDEPICKLKQIEAPRSEFKSIKFSITPTDRILYAASDCWIWILLAPISAIVWCVGAKLIEQNYLSLIISLKRKLNRWCALQ